ncbi:methionine synthase I [Rhodobacterales bacterium HKCCE2091]|nr:methionine synthase I [Rhodobacterales bacterium HKCCE2091]
MGLIERVIGGSDATRSLGESVGGVAEVFTPNATRRMELSAEIRKAAMAALASEYEYERAGPFDRVVNALNRLPRPLLAFGTLGLFVFAMVDPAAFTRRMAGLEHVPEPLWWLLGAIVSFYFGARELNYWREGGRGSRRLPWLAAVLGREDAREPETGENAAISAWRNGMR